MKVNNSALAPSPNACSLKSTALPEESFDSKLRVDLVLLFVVLNLLIVFAALVVDKRPVTSMPDESMVIELFKFNGRNAEAPLSYAWIKPCEAPSDQPNSTASSPTASPKRASPMTSILKPDVIELVPIPTLPVVVKPVSVPRLVILG